MSRAAKPELESIADAVLPPTAANRSSGRRLRGSIAHYLGTAIVSGRIEPGTRLTGEIENADRIAYGIPDVLGRDRAAYAGRRVLVGGGHSAINVALDLLRLEEVAPYEAGARASALRLSRRVRWTSPTPPAT
jgi:hypothetical protein